MNKPEDVIIIGGGPAGLSAAYELAQLGVHALILEQGAQVGASWSRMPDSLKLLSPWFQNTLFERKSSLSNYYSLKPARNYAEYLREECHRLNLRASTAVKVENVEIQDGVFEVNASGSVFSSQRLINATGYFSSPWSPVTPGVQETKIHVFHFQEYRNASFLRDLLDRKYGTSGEQRRVLVVGKRVSAGQLIEELYSQHFKVAVSCQSKILFSRNPLLQSAVFPFYFAVEQFIAQRWTTHKHSSYPPMQGGYLKKLVTSDKIVKRPVIRKFLENEVEFVDGVQERYDAVIYATGFRPTFDHLRGLSVLNEEGMPDLDGFRSKRVPNLYFLGLDGQRNFRSRYLRGIRDDAKFLARELVANS